MKYIKIFESNSSLLKFLESLNISDDIFLLRERLLELKDMGADSTHNNPLFKNFYPNLWISSKKSGGSSTSIGYSIIDNILVFEKFDGLSGIIPNTINMSFCIKIPISIINTDEIKPIIDNFNSQCLSLGYLTRYNNMKGDQISYNDIEKSSPQLVSYINGIRCLYINIVLKKTISDNLLSIFKSPDLPKKVISDFNEFFTRNNIKEVEQNALVDLINKNYTIN